MSRAKFTPGPWMVNPANPLEVAPERRDKPGTIEPTLVTRVSSLIRNETDKANARLIAAAPELYETLNALMEIETCDKDMGEFGDDESVGAYQDDDGNILDLPLTFGHIRRARVALAKARGDA